MIRRRYFFIILILKLILVFLFVCKLDKCEIPPVQLDVNNFQILEETGHEKWIVITSINYPTEDVKRLGSLKDWAVVVVGDTKTPKDWNFPGVHFLSVEKQLSLGLLLPKALPFKTYTRKNVGYLYAIMNGAEWIYDTDDDNKPYGLGLEQFDYGEMVSGLRYTPRGDISEKLFNPYRFYGYKDMWPRGFPLEYFSDHTNGEDRMISCREMKPAAVQQGIVHKDPDVDAIYRLLHADRNTGLNVTFNKHAPPILLEAGTYSPWNSQNTLFNRRAFFTMFLPTTVEFRATDIWRSYFAQKMLHLIGESVAFYPVNAVQIRNAHNYLADFKDEIAVYTKSGEIIKYIDNFTCSSTETQECFMELARGFVNHKFILEADLSLIEAWIADLNRIGYKFPLLSAKNNMKVNISGFLWNCRSANVDLAVATKVEESMVSSNTVKKVEYFNDVLSWCNQSNVPNLPSVRTIETSHRAISALEDKKNTVLVLINNYPWNQSIGILQRLYDPYFATVVFCGSWNPNSLSHDELHIIKPINYVNLTEEEGYKGFLFYYCSSKVRDLRIQNVKGYYFVADDTVFNIWQPLPMNVSLIANAPKMDGIWWREKGYGQDAAKKFVNLMEGKYANDTRAQAIWKKYDERVKANGFKSAKQVMLTSTGRWFSDFYYLPSTDLQFFADMSEYLAESKLFVEISTRKIFHALNYKRLTNFLYTYKKPETYNIVHYKSSLIGTHPIKLRATHTDLEYRETFCSRVISSFYKKLFQSPLLEEHRNEMKK